MTDQSMVELVGDIGGTNARFALAREGDVRPHAIEVLPCGEFDNLDGAIRAYMERVGVERIKDVCLAVAGPVPSPNDPNAQVRMTNNHWRFGLQVIREQFGLRSFKVINDFTAMALGVPHVPQEHLIHVCGGPGDVTRARLVIGPGTGLGVSGLVPLRDGWVPLMTEGGHVDFAPTDEVEIAILQILKARFGRVSVERILCGQGLLNLYQAHAEIQGVAAPLDTPAKITAAAVSDADSLARHALRHFCEILGRTAGNAALTLGSVGGVYLCGGILPRFIEFFLESPFQAAFEDKGRMRPLMERTPVHVVTEPYTGLLGAAEALRNPEVS
ncbi:glucokinase [Marinobacter bohaiensis]|uniref:glucokinase n=1 Tax=Marinobacter bohaiensis TaxID=2201898 RepID=UPI001D173554|nr:glucokinase [Marinobacter bohaiensis]